MTTAFLFFALVFIVASEQTEQKITTKKAKNIVIPLKLSIWFRSIGCAQCLAAKRNATEFKHRNRWDRERKKKTETLILKKNIKKSRCYCIPDDVQCIDWL